MRKNTLEPYSNLDSDHEYSPKSPRGNFAEFFYRRARELSEATHNSATEVLELETLSRKDNSRRSTNNYAPYMMESSHQNHPNDYSQINIPEKITALKSSFQAQFDGESIGKKSSTISSLKTLNQNHPIEDYNDPELLKGYIKIREQTEFEKIEEAHDRYPLLPLRKAMRRIKSGISQFCFLIVGNSLFEAFMIIVIIANAVILVIEDPNSDQEQVSIGILNDIFLYIYTAECALKIVSFGLFFSKTAYFRDS